MLTPWPLLPVGVGSTERNATTPTSAVSATKRVWVAPEPIKYIVMEMTPVMSIDSTALHMLEDLRRDLKERGIQLAFSTVGNRVEDTLERVP